MNTWTKEQIIELFAEAFHEVMPVIINPISERLDRIEQRLDGMEHRLDNVELRLDKIEQRLDKVEQRMDKVESRLDSIERTLGKLLIRENDQDIKIDVLEEKVATIRIV